MDIAVNKPAKRFLKRKFEQWYSEEVTKQLEGVAEIESAELQPLDFSLAVVKELTAKWLVEMVEYLADNPQFMVLTSSVQVFQMFWMIMQEWTWMQKMKMSYQKKVSHHVMQHFLLIMISYSISYFCFQSHKSHNQNAFLINCYYNTINYYSF